MLPGTAGIHDEIALLEAAERIGFPVILKASAGGGGRGMKIVYEKEKLLEAWSMGRTEAQAAFGNPEMFMERYCQKPRHIEIQVIGDKHGHYTHLGERECSIQRRHQKVIEEAPSASLPEATRQKMTEASVKAIEAIGYTNVGTMEYLLDTDGSFYFMEMNTRLQVEHPVTELVTGLDIVREQIRIAAGEPLSFKTDRKPRGHAIELRVNAEDPNDVRAVAGQDHGGPFPGWSRCTCRYARVCRLRRAAELRLAPRKSHRPRRRSARCGSSRSTLSRGDGDRRTSHQHPVLASDRESPRLHFGRMSIPGSWRGC